MVKRKEYTGLSLLIFTAASEKVGKRQVQAKVAKLLGCVRAAISSRMRGQTSWKAEEVEIIAKWLGISVGGLYGGTVTVPVMGAVAANPTPELIREVTDEPEEFLELPQKMMAFTVYDSSMEPLARPGQKILINPSLQVLSGDLVVAHILEGEGAKSWMFKRYERQRVGKGWKALLQSVAPGIPTLVLPEENVKLWKVVGLWLLPSARWSGPL
jgi:SOS-response transcriptional repressor LexA